MDHWCSLLVQLAGAACWRQVFALRQTEKKTKTRIYYYNPYNYLNQE